jgi:hypothetical protein
LGVFLEALEKHYQEVKESKGVSRHETMATVAKWVADQDRGLTGD